MLADKIEGWHVDTGDSFSDHRYINFVLTLTLPEGGMARNFQKANWKQFKDDLDLIEWVEPYRWSCFTLETEVAALYAHIEVALDKNCPLKPSRPRGAKLTWWSGTLEGLRRKTRDSFERYRLTRTNFDHESYRIDRRVLKRAVRKAKSNSWRKFCSEIPDEKNMAHLTKVIRRIENRNLGILKDSTGHMCKGLEESMKILLDTHFPGSVEVSDQEISTQVKCVKSDLLQFNYISTEKVLIAISMFGADKAAGQDGLKPIVLQNFPLKTIERITVLFRASLALKYTPLAWRLSRAIFIPKPGRDDYSNVKSFRPISLMSYIFKAMERTIMWELEASYLQCNPLERSQHAFRAGRSTESALSEAVDTIEQAVLRTEFAMGSFMDIDGAFDNLDPAAVINGLQKKGVPCTLLEWFNSYLRGRTVKCVDRMPVCILCTTSLVSPQLVHYLYNLWQCHTYTCHIPPSRVTYSNGQTQK